MLFRSPQHPSQSQGYPVYTGSRNSFNTAGSAPRLDQQLPRASTLATSATTTPTSAAASNAAASQMHYQQQHFHNALHWAQLASASRLHAVGVPSAAPTPPPHALSPFHRVLTPTELRGATPAPSTHTANVHNALLFAAAATAAAAAAAAGSAAGFAGVTVQDTARPRSAAMSTARLSDPGLSVALASTPANAGADANGTTASSSAAGPVPPVALSRLVVSPTEVTSSLDTPTPTCAAPAAAAIASLANVTTTSNANSSPESADSGSNAQHCESPTEPLTVNEAGASAPYGTPQRSSIASATAGSASAAATASVSNFSPGSPLIGTRNSINNNGVSLQPIQQQSNASFSGAFFTTPQSAGPSVVMRRSSGNFGHHYSYRSGANLHGNGYGVKMSSHSAMPESALSAASTNRGYTGVSSGSATGLGLVMPQSPNVSSYPSTANVADSGPGPGAVLPLNTAVHVPLNSRSVAPSPIFSPSAPSNAVQFAVNSRVLSAHTSPAGHTHNVGTAHAVHVPSLLPPPLHPYQPSRHPLPRPSASAAAAAVLALTSVSASSSAASSTVNSPSTSYATPPRALLPGSALSSIAAMGANSSGTGSHQQVRARVLGSNAYAQSTGQSPVLESTAKLPAPATLLLFRSQTQFAAVASSTDSAAVTAASPKGPTESAATVPPATLSPQESVHDVLSAHAHALSPLDSSRSS